MKTRFAIQYFMLFVLLGTISPYMQRFLRAKGYDEATVGTLLGVMQLAACGPILLGSLADRFGRRRTMLVCIGLAAALLGPLLLCSAPWQVGLLLAGLGLVTSMFIPLTDTLAANELPDPAHTYGRVRIWGSVGFVFLLAVIGGAGFIDEASPASMITAMFIGSALFLASTSFMPDRHRSAVPADPRDGDVHFDAVFYLFLAVGAMHQFGMSGHYNFFSNYAVDVLGLPRGAWTWAIGSTAEMPFLFLGGWLVRRLGIRTMLILSCLAVSVRIGTYAAFPFAAAVLPIQILHAPVFALRHAASIEFLRRKVPARRRGLAMALYMSLAIGVPMWAGSTLGGAITHHYRLDALKGYDVLYGLYAIPPLLGVLCVLIGGRKFNVPLDDGTISRTA